MTESTGWVKENWISDIRNCLIYNYQNNNNTAIRRNFYTEGNYNAWVAAFGVNDIITQINYVKNICIQGPLSTSNDESFSHNYNCSIYASQNLGPASPSTPVDGFTIEAYRVNKLWDGHVASPSVNLHGTYSTTNYDSATPFTAPAIVETAPGDLFAELTTECGATLPSKDSTWTRIMDYIIADTGPSALVYFDVTEGYPTLAGGSYPTDTSGDGMPDAWKSANGLDPLVDDSQTPHPGSGYWWIEVYVNEVAGDTAPAGSSAPVNTVPATQDIAKNTSAPVAISVTDDDGNITSIVLNCDEGEVSVTLSEGVTAS